MRRWWRTRSATVKTMPAFCAFSHKAGFSRRVPEVWLNQTIDDQGMLDNSFLLHLYWRKARVHHHPTRNAPDLARW